MRTVKIALAVASCWHFLEALLVEGLTSGEGIPLTKEFWRELKSEAAGIARKHHARKKL